MNMPPADNAFSLPDNLPVPQDDGGCRHLAGMALPHIALRSTAGRDVDLSQLAGRTVVYCYPLTGRPGVALPTGWNDIPGARGCTPESCGFRDHHRELIAHGATAVFGFSTQDTDYQREAAERLHLPFELLSDSDFEFVNALKLPTFEVDGMTLVKRLTLIIRDGRVEHVFYPVFPPDGHAAEVLGWLSSNPLRS